MAIMDLGIFWQRESAYMVRVLLYSAPYKSHHGYQNDLWG
jgi:hypothetical protein